MKKFTLIPHERYLQYQTLLDKQTDPTSFQPVLSPDDKTTHEVLDVTHTTNQQQQQQQSEHAKLNSEHIISQLPRRNKSKALSLLSVVDNSPRIDWNNKGELVVDHNCIEFSHITDVLHDALNNTRRRSLIGGNRLKTTQLPPPGIPDKPSVPLNNWQTLWRSY